MKSLLRRLQADTRGQSVIEFAMVMPLLVVVVLGVIETGYALLDQHVVTKMSREGSNLISRETSLGDAATAMKAMSGRPVDFTTNSRLIFSVVRRGATSSTTNYNKDILYQRYEFGAISGASALTTRGAGSFSGGPDYTAAGADTDSSLQITNLPAGLLTTAGDMVYITEIYTKHELITPFDKFGVKVPDILYSIAYF